MTDLTENQKQLIRKWRAIKYTEDTDISDINEEICKLLDNSSITKKEILGIIDTLKEQSYLYEELNDMIFDSGSEFYLENLKDDDLVNKNFNEKTKQKVVIGLYRITCTRLAHREIKKYVILNDR